MATSVTGNDAAGANNTAGGNAQPSNTKSEASPTAPSNNFPPPKTDKPRPHQCQTCGRSFARLEHLKRHERSHTKEKPFECPQCTRCFARRDLLLRHQQKLHQAGAASSRPRNGRRESTSGMSAGGGGRVRKNSVAGSVAGNSGIASTASMRPRANTISHIDGAALSNLIASTNQGTMRNPGMPTHSHHASLSGFGMANGLDYRGMSTTFGNHGNPAGLHKLDTHLGTNLGGGLRTAPIPGMNDNFDFDKLFGQGSTINPAQLHFGNSFGNQASPFQNFPPLSGAPPFEEDETFDWTAGFDPSLLMNSNNEQAADGSSPSAISTASQSGFSEVMLDGSNQAAQTSTAAWQNPLMTNSTVNSTPFTLDNIGTVPLDLLNPLNTISPADIHEQVATQDFYLTSPPPLTGMSPTTGIPGMPNQYFHPPLAFNSDSQSISSSSVNGSSARHSSVTSVSTDTITDSTRQALLITLSQALGYGHGQRKYPQPSVSSPLSPGFGAKTANQYPSLPSTADLQRYVGAYIQYFHPHMPFLHIPTLSFESPMFKTSMPMGGHTGFGQEGVVGGGGCLIVAMAAIGALYEFEHSVAKDLFEASKKMILFYLEERRRAGVSAAMNGSGGAHGPAAQATPLWLVQAMLLNLIFGHNCGDQQAAEVASTHCAALVSLAKAANLAHPEPEISADSVAAQFSHTHMDGDIEMGENDLSVGFDEHAQWIRWKTQEERKRTLFAVFVLSSLLVTAYNHSPRILNSELQLSLPCDEDLWAADSARTWATMGGAAAADSKALSFADALGTLLTTFQRHDFEHSMHPSFDQTVGSGLSVDQLPECEIKPSTFGCYILINALHVYIWETRQRHNGHWLTQETEEMHSQIEPALKAWQAAWRSHPHHSLERPNPFGPLSADSIPLLDLAYVRLFVNLGRSKDGFWRRDYDAMAEELARGVEIVQHAENSPVASSDQSENSMGTQRSSHSPDTLSLGHDIALPGQTLPGPVESTKREKHLRKAAFYAADSLSMSHQLGVTFAEWTSRELPLQSAMCNFDCAQVLAEWVATVQERVGRYLGIIGKDEIDFTAVPAIMLLDDHDIDLLRKISEIIGEAEKKMMLEFGGVSGAGYGYGSKLLVVTAHMLEKAAVWPVTHTMARALEAHAAHMQQRAQASTVVTNTVPHKSSH